MQNDLYRRIGRGRDGREFGWRLRVVGDDRDRALAVTKSLG
ncbi:hypothetical protein QFZ54_000525 [Sphingomonas faeni]|nr:hypothetical protein [Sphingomonas faeni]